MIKKIEQYIPIVGDAIVSNLIKKSKKLINKKILNINSTFIGGGVSEILKSLVPLVNNIGIDSEWRVLHGNPDFYNISKKIHNGLQGSNVTFSDEEKKLYLETNEEYCTYTDIKHDFVIIHDPQPLPIAQYIHQKQPWIWRCHIDLSEPNKDLWNFLKPLIFRYDIIIVSREEYKKNDLPIEQTIISPAIDPLIEKNLICNEENAKYLFKKYGIPTDKPLISQVSRMDIWKDPEGLLEIFRKVKEKVDCRLLYCYNSAPDDPEGEIILNRIKEKCKDLKNDVLFYGGENARLVNAVQTFSNVIVQKSIKEGFCLAVTEALWKGTPVVASNVGGIPSQIIDGETGYLVNAYDYNGFSDKIVELLKNKNLSKEIGMKAREYVKNNFLVTRLIDDYLNLLNYLVN